MPEMTVRGTTARRLGEGAVSRTASRLLQSATMKTRVFLLVVAAAGVLGTTAEAQKPARSPSPPLPPLPVTLFTSEFPVRVVAVATGLAHPWSLAFLPDGSMLVTERGGRLRIVRHGVLDPRPIDGVPPVYDGRLAGLLDVALHPKFSENRIVYL